MENTPEPSLQLAKSLSIPKSEKICSICNKEFRKPCKLAIHIKAVHEQIRDFKCDLCDQTFTRKDHLTRHSDSKHAIDRSTLECPYLATEGCLMSFPNKDQLRKHCKRTHEKKKLQCQMCLQMKITTSFIKKSQLRKHIQVEHSDSFVCKDHCNKKFQSQKYLSAHLKRVNTLSNLKRSKLYNFNHSSQAYSDEELSNQFGGDIYQEISIEKRLKVSENQSYIPFKSDKHLTKLTPDSDESSSEDNIQMCGTCGRMQTSRESSLQFSRHASQCTLQNF